MYSNIFNTVNLKLESSRLHVERSGQSPLQNKQEDNYIMKR